MYGELFASALTKTKETKQAHNYFPHLIKFLTHRIWFVRRFSYELCVLSFHIMHNVLFMSV